MSMTARRLLLAAAAGLAALAAAPAPDTRLALGEADLVVAGDAVGVEAGGAAAARVARLPTDSTLLTAQGDVRTWTAAGTARRGAGRELVLLAGDSAGARRLPAPPGGARVRDWPVLFHDPHGLRGVAWLEGADEQSLAVRAARWNGEAWDAAATVAPPGPGSQLALAGAVLADGSWLLVWSAFDGEDDEILWSRSRADGWTSPARVAPDNHVPDVTPAIAAFGRGALVAWSRYDGHDYRVVVARIDGDRFTPPDEIGPPGSVQPTLASAGSRAVLAFRTVIPSQWRAVELDRQARPVRFAAAAVHGDERPSLRARSDGAIELVWSAGGEPLRWQALP